MIEVSWQFAVCAQEPSSDLALSGAVELRLAEQLPASRLAAPNPGTAARMMGKTRHLARFEVGNVPNLSTESLSIADAIAIRQDDAFEAFRTELRSAVDQLDQGLSTDKQAYAAQAAFEERMRAASDDLARRVQKTSFRTRVRDSSVPAAIGAAGTLMLSPPWPGVQRYRGPCDGRDHRRLAVVDGETNRQGRRGRPQVLLDARWSGGLDNAEGRASLRFSWCAR
ncbi:hypothetical protein GCM10010492_20730 [Saccharothrix mutabilis subsp. mutabilis]|uniref:Uncharacterized protein n=1 Tax=Saccharothrix mutabilis subsp. mutabilis TaxID=66855 RepID=A0ABN0TIC6_9PSEU